MSYIINLLLSNNTSSIWSYGFQLYDLFNKKTRGAYLWFTYLMVHLISFFNNNLVIFFLTVI